MWGIEVLNNAPPIPAQVVSFDGRVLFDGNAIRDGQNAWQLIGGQEVGTVWGHGSYVAPDWTADWLHHECVFILDRGRMNRAPGIARLKASSSRQLCKHASNSSCGETPTMLLRAA